MKTKFTLIAFLLTSFMFSTFSQSSNITAVQSGGLIKHYSYYKCDIELTNSQLINIFKNDPRMKEYYKPIVLNYTASALLKSASGILILWPLTDVLNSEEPNWTLAGIGAGCALLAIPFSKSFDRHALKAIDHYNTPSPETSADKVELNVNVGVGGIAMVVNF